MTDNPYSAPTASVCDPAGAAWSWRPVALGAVVSIGLFYSLAMLIRPILEHWYSGQGVAPETLYQTLTTSVGAVLLWHLLAVCGFTVGGYVAARSAAHRPILSALLSAALAKLVLLAQYAGVFPNPYPGWSQVLGFITPAPAALLGAWLCLRAR